MRWILFIFWTGFIFYTMDVFKPSEVQWVGSVAQWFSSKGLPSYTPAKIFHWCVFSGWTFLLGGALEGAYWTPLSLKNLRICICALFAFVAVPEGLQYFNPARTPAILDVAINFVGGIGGLVFRSVVGRHRHISAK